MLRLSKTTEPAWNVLPPDTSPSPTILRVDVGGTGVIRVRIRVSKSRFTLHSFAFEDKKSVGVCKTMIGSCAHITVFLTDLVTALSSLFYVVGDSC